MQELQHETPRLLTAQQVTRMLGVDRSTVYRMALSGRLPAVKVGRQWRFPAERLHRLLVEARETVRQPAPAAPESPVRRPSRVGCPST